MIAERVLGSVAFMAAPELEAFGEAAQRLADAGREAFVGGVGDAVLVGAVILLAGAVVRAAIALRSRGRDV